MEISIAILLAMLAAASPSILSIVGLAGGTIIVPALVLLFGLEARFAAGTTIFALIFGIFCARALITFTQPSPSSVCLPPSLKEGFTGFFAGMLSECSLEDIEGVGPATARKLREAGYVTVESLAVATAFELSEATGIGYDTALKISQAARELVKISLVTADEVLKRRQLAQKITTGSKSLDSLLGGGVETQAMTELVGEFGTGKTQLCHTLCVTVQLPKDRGGLEAGALFIDTEGTFRPERIVQIARKHRLEAEKALKNIVYARVYNSDHQVLLVDKAWEICGQRPIRLIIVDSLTSQFRGEYLGREALALRQQRLNSHVHKLLKLAEALNLAVVVTNQVVANPGQFFGDPNKPAGGNVVAHASTYRLFLRKGKENTRVAYLFDAPHLPYGEAPFILGEGGIADAPGSG